MGFVYGMCLSYRGCSFLFSFFVAAFLTQTVCLDDTTVKFEIWDTAGQERYHSLAPMYYRGAQAAIIVYDITSQVSTFCLIIILKWRGGGTRSGSTNSLNHNPAGCDITNDDDVKGIF